MHERAVYNVLYTYTYITWRFLFWSHTQGHVQSMHIRQVLHLRDAQQYEDTDKAVLSRGDDTTM